MDDGVAGAARSGARRLVGPATPPPATLIVAGDLLSVKVFGCFGTRAKCCVDSSSDSEGSSSSESDEEDSVSDDEGVGRQDANPDFD